MAVRTKAQLEALNDQLFPSSGQGEISAVDLRSFFGDLLDSLAFLTDVQSGGISEQRVNELIELFVSRAVQGNIETGIVVEYAGGKLNFVVTASGGGSGVDLATVLAAIRAGNQIDIDRTVDGQITISYAPSQTGDHNRYALWSSSGATPTAAQFLSATASPNDVITVPATPGGVASFLHFADIHAALSDIRETGSAFNSRGLFAANPVQLDIGGTPHYVYSSRFAVNPYAGAQSWTLTP